MLAATQTTESDGMCCTSYQILVLVLSGEHGGKATDATQRPESYIRTRLRWAKKEMVSSKNAVCQKNKNTIRYALWPT